MTWTNEDEAAFQAMMERRQATVNTLRGSVQRLVNTWGNLDLRHADLREALTEQMIENAATIRAVLEPFDPKHPQYIKGLT